MLFAEGTPNTLNYYIAGYVVFFTIMTIYLVSLYIRNRNLKRDLATLKEMEQSDEPES
jgi:hypothetical protein